MTYGIVDERTPLNKTAPPDYVFMTNPNRMYRKQVHQFQCCICAAVLAIFTTAIAITILYSVDNDTIDVIPELPSDNASLQLLLGQSWPLPDDGVPSWQIDPPSPEEVEAAIAEGKSSLAAKDKLEASNPSLPVNSPSYRHQVSIKTSAKATNLARSAYVMEVATKKFILNKSKPKNLTKTVGRGPVLTSDWLPMEECGVGPLPPCPPTPYRSVDGTCNNPYKPNKWGVSMRPYRRQLAPNYADGVSAPRVATDGSPLPSAREVSVTVHRPAYSDDPKFTVMLAVWGQFMDHDLTAFALSLGEGGKTITCCGNSSSPAHPECYPVYLAKDDPYYKQFGITCLEFVRSAPAPTCTMGPREQLNQVSSYLDGSVVYGNTVQLSQSLRSFQGGELKMLKTPDGRSLLPISTNLEDGCNREAENAKGRYCFMTGDTRANENTHLTSLHLLMARQHNLIAGQLAELNPDWNDETLYQESRKVVAAQMQHITYNEFLPVLLGPDMMSELELNPKETGYYTDYDPSVDATISNAFATSAFRFAHTLLPALMKTVAKDWGSEESIEMHKMLFDPFKLYQTGALDKVVQGAINTKLERADSYFNTQVTQHLFQATGEDDVATAPKYGLDLVSLNVQRGRDHGLPGYTVWRQFCGLPRPKSFEELNGLVDPAALARIKTLYKSVDDIDMYTGALSEFPIEGGMVGPTITCLVSDQFKRLKKGDSFWYETDKKPQSFTPDQLDEIRKTTLASIICDTSDEVTMVQQEVMKTVSLSNTRMACSKIPRPDLTKWAAKPKLSEAGGKVKTKYNRVEVSVTGGSITTTSGEVLWDGTVPVTIPLPLFSLKTFILGSSFGAYIGHGVQWEGSLSTRTDGLDIVGTFSYPIFTHGPIPLGENYTVKWVNGEFQISAIVTSNDTDVSQLKLPGSYESPIYFSSKKTEVTGSKKQLTLGASGEDVPLVIGVEKLPLILVGTKSPDKTSFFWSGNATITIPSTVAPPLLTSSEDKPEKEKDKTSISGIFSVAGGNIKLDSPDGSSKSIWNGELPAAIPLPVPFKVLKATETGENLVSFGNGLVWSASLSGTSLEGSFSLPQYDRSLGVVSVNWINGQFKLEVVPISKGTLEELLIPGVKYTSRIIFRETPAPVNMLLSSVFSSELEAPNSLEDLVVESQEVIDGIVPAPLILYGTYSPDKTVFYFNGNVILAIKPTKSKIEKQLQSLSSPEISSPWTSPKFGGIITSGYVKAGLNEGDSSTVWAGTLPVEIPGPIFFSPTYDSLDGKSFLFGNGVIWSGTLSGSTIKGTFSLPQTIWSISGVKLQNWSGEFLFDVSPLWNTSLASIFVPGTKYYSKVHFQGAKNEPGLSTLKGVPGEDPAVTQAAPIILQGSFSPDKKIFNWSGGFIIVIQNKPVLMFKIPPKPSNYKPSTKPTASIQLNIVSGSIVAGFTDSESMQVWSGKLPATIPLNPLLSKENLWQKVPYPNIMWSGSVKDQTFIGTFAVPTYTQNGTVEIVRWWTGNFTFKYTTKFGKLLENYIKPNKKYDFQLGYAAFKESVPNGIGTSNNLVKFTQEAGEVIGDAKVGKLILNGMFYSKPFYCAVLPFCSEKNEFYWSGSAVLVFPDPPRNLSSFGVLNSVQAPKTTASQFAGKVISGSVEGGLKEESTFSWWSGSLPVNIPTSIFWSNKTKASAAGSSGGMGIQWSGSLIGNTLKGTFSFPQWVMNFPAPTVQWWSGQFSFDIQPLWNTTLDGLIESETTYSSGIYFQGLKVTEVKSGLKAEIAAGTVTQKAPIILQGTLSPDRSTFLWSGNFIISVKKYPVYNTLSFSLGKTKVKPVSDGSSTIKPPKPKKPTTPPKPVKPKTTVSFTVITGKLSATNGTEPMQFWGGELPIEINTGMFNPTNTPGAGVSITWSPETTLPEISGTFSVRTYLRNGSVLLPVSWSGNFSMHYLIKWSGSFDGLVKPGKLYTCNVVFKDMVKSSQEDPGYIAEPYQKFVLGAGEGSGTPCTILLNGKSYTKNVNPYYCRVVPFMCSNKPLETWFSFSGDAMLIIKPPADVPPEQLILPTPPTPSGLQMLTSRNVNTKVISGSIVAGPESEYPSTLWSGSFPINISLPVFWNSEDISNVKVPIEDVVHAHGVIWSGSQMGPRVEGSFSLPQYSKTGMKWWAGRFSFLFQTDWGVLGDLDDLVASDINYYSRIVFRDINSPMTLLSPSQFDIDTSTSMPIILLGTYSSDRKIFYWPGNVVIGIRDNPWNVVNKSPNLQLGGPSGKWPMKPKQRVGVLITSGNLSSTTEGSPTQWSGSTPVMIPLSEFNVTKGINVIWTASAIYPTLSGKYSIPHYVKDAEGFKIQWLEGTFSFNAVSLWNTTLDIIEVGKQYATIISSSSTKLSKADKEDMYNSFLSLIMESADLNTSQIGQLSLKGFYSPDSMYFTWQGEAWFYGEKNKTVIPKNVLHSSSEGILKASQFGGSVYDGAITTQATSFFSFSSNVWSGTVPVKIPFSAFWSGSFDEGSKFTRGVSWTATSITDSFIEGTYSLQKFTWDGITSSVSEVKGNFNFYIRPIWNATLTTLIKPGVEYYSRVTFQGGKPPLMKTTDVTPGIRVPIILQGSYSPDRTEFFWSGNFILDVKKPTNILQLGSDIKPPNEPKPVTIKGPKLNQRVGAIVSTVSLSKGSAGNLQPWWSGSPPVTFPVDEYNLSKGIKVVWTASTLYPKFSGSFSIATSESSGWFFPVEWTDGSFSFDVTPIWMTSLDVIEVGKQYATIITTNATKVTKAEREEIYSNFTRLLADTKGFEGSIGNVILKGTYSPDNMYFTWLGEAWFYPGKNKSDTPAPLLFQAKMDIKEKELAKPFGGSVYDGSVTTGTSSFFSFTHSIWSGVLPANIPISSFWSGSFTEGPKFTRGVTWTASSVTDSYLTGSYSVPQYSWNGFTTTVTWYKGDFKFYIKPSWNASLTSLIQPGVQYYSRINFQGDKAPLLDVYDSVSDLPGIRVPITLQGTYTPDRTSFSWNGNFILDKKESPPLLLAGPLNPLKPSTRVGAIISSIKLTNNSGGSLVPWWSGNPPVTFPLDKFNVSKGVHVIWSAATLYPKFTGNFTIAQYISSAEDYPVLWTDGAFEFNVMPLWGTTLDVIEIGKQYATVITAKSKSSKDDKKEMPPSFLELIMESTGLDGSQIGTINLKGMLSPDKTNFTWLGEAWFYPEKNTTSPSKLKLTSASSAVSVHTRQFGGTATAGIVTAGASCFLCFSRTIWSGELPSEIKFSTFWSKSFDEGSKFTRGVTWTADTVTNSFFTGSYSVPQFSWNGISRAVTWYEGDFKFHVKPLWNTTLTSLIQPGTQYYSRISFQGGPVPPLESALVPDASMPGTRVPIILQGIYSPDHTSFYWSGNFILRVDGFTIMV